MRFQPINGILGGRFLSFIQVKINNYTTYQIHTNHFYKSACSKDCSWMPKCCIGTLDNYPISRCIEILHIWIELDISGHYFMIRPSLDRAYLPDLSHLSIKQRKFMKFRLSCAKQKTGQGDATDMACQRQNLQISQLLEQNNTLLISIPFRPFIMFSMMHLETSFQNQENYMLYRWSWQGHVAKTRH